MDPVSKYTCLRLVKGSHTWPQYFKPVHFDGPPFSSYEIKPGQEEEAKRFLPTLDFDCYKDNEVLTWDMEVSKICLSDELNTSLSAYSSSRSSDRPECGCAVPARPERLAGTGY